MNNNDKISFSKMATNELEERKAQILHNLPSVGHMIHGSLVTSFMKCGKPNCRCAKGEGHKTLRLSSFYHGRKSVDHVPASYEQWMREGIENYKAAEEMLLELAEIYLALFKRRGKD
jgi:hypothetical protein